MKVKDLIKFLNRCDPDDTVVLSSDAEGNDYKELCDYDYNLYLTGGVIYDEAELAAEEIDENDTIKCVVLWPI